MSDYHNNAFDCLHNEIAELYRMVEEIGLDKKLFSDEERTLLYKHLAEELAETTVSYNLLVYGFKGLRNFTDIELLVAVQEEIAAYCGKDDDIYEELGEWGLAMELTKTAKQTLLNEVTENSLLKR